MLWKFYQKGVKIEGRVLQELQVLICMVVQQEENCWVGFQWLIEVLKSVHGQKRFSWESTVVDDFISHIWNVDTTGSAKRKCFFPWQDTKS